MKTSTRTAFAATALAVALALTGCVGTGGGTPTGPGGTDPAGNSSTETPRPSESTAPVAQGLKVGDVVSGPNAPLTGAQRAYKMGNGTYMVIDYTKLLPAPVVADVKAKAVPLADAVASGNPNDPFLMHGMMKDNLPNAHVVFVVRTKAILTQDVDNPNAVAKTVYTVNAQNRTIAGFYTESEAQVSAQQYVADQGGVATGWESINLY